ncbi:MAG: tetratricopeptide repeat protein [Planctomycetota bacterium]
MARMILAAALLVSTFIVVGCESTGPGESMVVLDRPLSARIPDMAEAGEMDIVEQVINNREAYRESMNMLVQYYTETGNHEKLVWARKELRDLNTMAQYNYVTEAIISGPDLVASDSILEADFLYQQALDLKKTAGPVLRNKKTLRLALANFNGLIRMHPSSDKIDDAAFQAGDIYQQFKDYTIAVVYFRRTYQWNPATPYPARFREAFILDNKLLDRAGALDGYTRAIENTEPGQHLTWVKFAEKRIRILDKTDVVPRPE